MDDEEIRRLIEQIRQSEPAPPGPAATDESIPMLSEIVSRPAQPNAVPIAEGAWVVALEARIIGQVLERLLSGSLPPGDRLDEAVQSALARLRDTLAAELRSALEAALREQLERRVREAVHDAVWDAVDRLGPPGCHL